MLKFLNYVTVDEGGDRSWGCRYLLEDPGAVTMCADELAAFCRSLQMNDFVIIVLPHWTSATDLSTLCWKLLDIPNVSVE